MYQMKNKCSILFALVWANIVFANTQAALPQLNDPNLVVCGQNVENYYIDIENNSYAEDKSREAFESRTQDIVEAFSNTNADIFALCEVEVGSETLEYLANALSIKSGKTFKAVSDDISAEYTYNKACFIYRADVVKPIGDNMAASTSGVYTYRMRIQAFEEIASGERFVLSMNHFKAYSDGASTRVRNAENLLSSLKYKTLADPDILIMGDLNCNIEEEALQKIVNAGYEEQLLRFDAGAYSYIYNYNPELIDHALANESMAEQVTGAGVYHVNTSYSSNSYSDHDPYLVGLSLGNGTHHQDDTINVPKDSICENIKLAYSVSAAEGFKIYNVNGYTIWAFTADGAEINAYNDDAPNEDWLITPKFDLTAFDDTVKVSFETYNQYQNGDIYNLMTMWVSNDYETGKLPETAHWTQIPIMHPERRVSSTISVFPSDEFKTDNVHFAFKYECNEKWDASHWRISAFTIEGLHCKHDTLKNAVENLPTKQFFVINHYIYSVDTDLKDVMVYSVTGESFNADAYLPSGFYIITDGKNTQKVIVR